MSERPNPKPFSKCHECRFTGTRRAGFSHSGNTRHMVTFYEHPQKGTPGNPMAPGERLLKAIRGEEVKDA